MKGSRFAEESVVVRFPVPRMRGHHEPWRHHHVLERQRSRTASRKRVSALPMVAIQRDDTWALTAFQNTRYRPWNRTALLRLMTVLNRRQLEHYRAASGNSGQTVSVVRSGEPICPSRSQADLLWDRLGRSGNGVDACSGRR